MIDPTTLDTVIRQIAAEIAADDDKPLTDILRDWQADPERFHPLITVRYRKLLKSLVPPEKPPVEDRTRQFRWPVSRPR